MPLTMILAILGLVALLGVAVDAMALRRGVARQFAYSALGLKAVVALMFAAWRVALELGLFTDWADLATLIGIMLVSLALLGVAIVCDVVTLSVIRRQPAAS